MGAFECACHILTTVLAIIYLYGILYSFFTDLSVSVILLFNTLPFQSSLKWNSFFLSLQRLVEKKKQTYRNRINRKEEHLQQIRESENAAGELPLLSLVNSIEGVR